MREKLVYQHIRQCSLKKQKSPSKPIQSGSK